VLTGDRLLRREDLECSRVSTMAERPTSVQQEADDVYQLLDSDLGREGFWWMERYTETQKHACLLCQEWKGIRKLKSAAKWRCDD